MGGGGVSSSDNDVGDSFQFAERLTDVLFTAASRDARHSDRIYGLGGRLRGADPCEEGQRGDSHNDGFHGLFHWIVVWLPQSTAPSVSPLTRNEQSGKCRTRSWENG